MALEASQHLLDVLVHRGDTVLLTQEPDEEGDIPVQLIIPTEQWREYGSPQSLTVGVVPGDTLNPGHSVRIIFESTIGVD